MYMIIFYYKDQPTLNHYSIISFIYLLNFVLLFDNNWKFQLTVFCIVIGDQMEIFFSFEFPTKKLEYLKEMNFSIKLLFPLRIELGTSGVFIRCSHSWTN